MQYLNTPTHPHTLTHTHTHTHTPSPPHTHTHLCDEVTGDWEVPLVDGVMKSGLARAAVPHVDVSLGVDQLLQDVLVAALRGNVQRRLAWGGQGI